MFGLIPAWWKLAAAAAVLVVLAGGAWKFRHGGVVEGRAEIQTKWDAEKLATSENSRMREKAATIATTKVDYALQQSKARDLAAGRATADSLRSFKAALAERDVATTPSGINGTGGLERELLGDCSKNLAEMAITADRLETKVVGLQNYTRNVCMIH